MKHPDNYFRYQLETKIVCSREPMPKHAGKEILPTDPIFAEKWAEEPMRLLRLNRNQKLSETDWWCCSDRIPTKAQLDYRTALRNLPATATPSLDENGNLTGVNWPTKPE